MLISARNVIYSMDKSNPPAAYVPIPAHLTFQTLDCFGGQIKTERDTVETLDFTRVNPATGPVYLDGVKAGDVIAVHIRKININSTGIMVAAPGAGVLGSMVKFSETMVVPIEGEVIRFKDLEIPVKAMIGVIGVAPKGEPVPCGTPGNHGGNMDTNLICAGSTLYLPVQVDGALLALGDLHAVMGNGEVMVTGVEVSGEVDISVELAKDLNIRNPLVVTSNEIATIASAETLDEAVKIATKDMAYYLQEWAGLTLNEAGMLMSACGNAEISQVVDPLKTARFSMPRHFMKRMGIKLAI